jgi:MFS transporter, PAT family, beta-lactamase induction signal transducer AmpG
MTEATMRRPTTADAFAAVRRDFRLAGILLMGVGPGISITISGGTIGFWLAENGFRPSAIGFLALAMLPFVLKFVWAPAIEGAFQPLRRLLGFRKSWLIPLNLLTVASIVLLSRIDPDPDNLAIIAAGAFVFSVFAASQEVVIEALRIDRTRGPAMPIGATLTGIGARFGMLIGSAGPLVIAARAGWPTALLALAGMMLLVTVGAMILGDADRPEGTAKPLAIRARVFDPFAEFFSREGALLVFLFMLVARLADTMAGSMFPPFATEAGFTKDQIAFASSVVGFAAVLVGSMCGIAIYRLLSERTGLFMAVIAAALTNVGFVILTAFPGDAAVLAFVMAFENLAAGIGAVIMLSYMSRLCDARYTATQFALLVAIGSLIRFVVPGPSGWLVERIGYETFFVVTILGAVPVLAVLALMTTRGLVSSGRPSPRRPDAAMAE